MRMSSAVSRKFVTSELPPYETNGSVTPVSGMSFAFPATMTSVWSATMKESPAARSWRNGVGARTAMSMPR